MPPSSTRPSDAVKKAEKFAEKAHKGQLRTSGEPFVNHVKAVADLLKEIHADDATLIAALLHDTVEDTKVTYKDLEKEFGMEIVNLVDGVTKVEQAGRQDKQERNLQFLRKMFRAMGKDIRVIFIKIADRLHNMQTMDAVPAEKQMRIARETQDIYCPLADMLGMRAWYQELSDRCFRILHPAEYDLIARKSEMALKNHGEDLKKWMAQFETFLRSKGWKDVTVTLTKRHYHAIHREYLETDGELKNAEMFFRVHVTIPNGKNCYACMGDLHEFSPPLPQQIDDYIAAPKINGYQALHTTIFSPMGQPVNVIIQTKEMAVQAQYGIAILYQEKHGSKMLSSMPDWIDTLVSLERDEHDLQTFFATIQSEIFGKRSRVTVIVDRKKKSVDLPMNASVLDLAYYTDEMTGKYVRGAIINNAHAPLSETVHGGDVVHFETGNDFLRLANDVHFLRTSFAEKLLFSNLAALPKREKIERGKTLLHQTIDIAMDPFFSITWQKAVREKINKDASALAHIGTGVTNPFLYLEDHSMPEDFFLLDAAIFHNVSGLLPSANMRYVLRTDMKELRSGNIIGLQVGPDIIEVVSADEPEHAKRFSKEYVPLLVQKELLQYPMHFALRFNYLKDTNPLEAIGELQGLLNTPVKLLKFEPSSITLGFNTDGLRPLQIAYEYLFGLPNVSHIFRITP